MEEISHDLRTPLTAILGYLKMMDRESLEAEDREALEVAVKKSETLQGLIQQFYELSQVTSENFRLEAERLDAASCQRVLSAYYRFWSRGNSKPKLNPDGPVWISAGRNGLERVISNLLKNIERYAVSEFYVILYSDGGRIRLVSAMILSWICGGKIRKSFLSVFIWGPHPEAGVVRASV